MKTILEWMLAIVLKISLWFRYRVTIVGLEKLNKETLNKPGGTLFLPNHPTIFVDASIASLALWPKYRLRPLIIEYMYRMPIINWAMRLVDALSVPNFYTSSNSLKRKKNEKVIQEVIKGLEHGQNFLIFPSGRVKHGAFEAIDGASAVHRLVQEAPNANVVLIRIKGLWGSSFSQALTGKNPAMFPTIMNGIKHILKNLIFFTPRRHVVVEIEPAPADFPYAGDRVEFNKYLERWYNRPDGMGPQKGDYPGDSLVLVSYSMWGNDFPTIWKPKHLTDEGIPLHAIPENVRKKVMDKVSELSMRDPSTIQPELNLTADLGLDSLDVAEIAAFLDDQFDVSGVTVEDLTTVGRLMAIASKLVVCEGAKEEEKDISKWNKPIPHKRIQLADGDTIPEVFLNSCARMGHAVACGDMRAGVVTYSQLKMRAILLAKYIQKLPGEYIGIMLPASVAASATILACQLAGKVPLMVNWTVGPRHLQAVMELSKVKTVLTSWAFIERLQNVDLAEMDDLLVMLEDVRSEFTLVDKLKALSLSYCPTPVILKAFGMDKRSKDSEAVLLFTSGTENMPKGVPLSHANILSNQRAALQSLEIYSDDVVFGILPPFHSFGFTVSSLIGLLAGGRVAYYPDPTNGKQLANNFARWGVTIMCGAPTFIRGMLKAATAEQLKTMRLCVTGAEKAPIELDLALDLLGKRDSIMEGYGITECAPVLTMSDAGLGRKGVGKPLPGVELCLVNIDTHAPVETGMQGMILARGPNIFSGYLNPGLASPFLTVGGKEWYVTGDLGHLDPEGNLIISGRLKRFIKVGGEMVSLASIEEALLGEAIKKGLTPTTQEGPILAICAKELPGEKPNISLYCKFPTTVDDVNKSLRDAGFSNLVRINSVTQLAEIPIMGSGKTNYRALETTNKKP